MAPQASAMRKVEDLDIGALVVSTVTGVVKKRPVGVSLWAFGLLLAAFANGFAVDDVTREIYSKTLSDAEDVEYKELNKALKAYNRADENYRNKKGWFWSCDPACQKAKDRADMARKEVERVKEKRDHIMNDARREVGIWSVYGVGDVRKAFWAAWQSGKEWALRFTMSDAFFMMLSSNHEESMMSFVLKVVFQYIMNLTLGLIGAFGFFIYNVYSLICAYGETTLSGLAFFLLVMVAGMATVGTYLVAIYGTVAGGGLFLVKQAAKQAAMENEAGRRPQRVQYGGYGRPGGFQQRAHYD